MQPALARARFTVVLALIGLLLGGAAVAPTPAAGLPLVSRPRIVLLGDSLTWQVCSGPGMSFGPDASEYLRYRDGGCFGWSGATTQEMSFMVQGGRFSTTDPTGQPQPRFDNRGQADPSSIREAIDRADVLVIGLGTNDADRMTYCEPGTVSPWPVTVTPAGATPPPCAPTLQGFRDQLAYYSSLANGRPIFWFDIAVHSDITPEHRANIEALNDAIWAQARNDPAFHPLAWERYTTAHPEWLRPSPDGTHLDTPNGGNAGRFRVLADALWGCGYR